MKKISCVIPVYNAQKYLKRCLDSICGQTFSSLEIILVDDGSTDESPIICDEYATSFSNIIVKHVSNGGASLARKKGLELASGEYITFIDSDDYVDTDYIECLYASLKDSNQFISACKVQKIKENEVSNFSKCSYKEWILNYDELMPRFFNYEFWGLCGKLYKKSIFEGIFFPRATLSEDYVVTAQLFNQYKSMIYIDKPLYFYEYHENSLSHQKLSKRVFEEYENVSYVYELILANSSYYKSHALSRVIETIVKLLMLEKEDNDMLYKSEFRKMRYFMKKHIIQMLFCKELLYKTKFLGIGLCFIPNITNFIYSKLRS